MLFGGNHKYKRCDEWETPIEYLEVIEPLIPKDLTINDPFYMNGNVKTKWLTLGRDIIHKKEDFFKIKKDDSKVIYVSSPPYSKINKILEHLFYLDKPFIMLMRYLMKPNKVKLKLLSQKLVL